MTSTTSTVVAVASPGHAEQISIFTTCSAAIRFAVAAQRRHQETHGDGAGPAMGVAVGELLPGQPAHGRPVDEARMLCRAAGPGRILANRAVGLVAGPIEVTLSPVDREPTLAGVAVDEVDWRAAPPPDLRVVLADDAVLIRQGIAALLQEEGLQVVGQTDDAETLVALVGELAPDLVVTDVRMPPSYTTEGLRAALEIRRTHPKVGVLVLSQHLETRYAVELLGGDAQGVGYLLKERVGAVDDFVAAVRRVASGGTAVDPEVVRLLIGRSERGGRLRHLSPREEEILALMAEGLSNPGIASHLTVSLRTVESHVAAIFTKLGLLADQPGERRVLAVIQYLRQQPTGTDGN
ncbi:MAG TPA: response regulator transcription factor [Acidimicrobiales bacterium]|nr:response regulator transcription factor [Acidimicrobiales bacterium]